MRCIVTGGAGLIGSHLTDHLIEKGHEVLVLDDFSGGSLNNLGKDVTYYQVDLRDKEIVDRLFDKFKPEVVYHLAANAAEGKSHFCPIDITSRNYETFLNVLVAGINNNVKRYVVTSSVAVYGGIQPPFKETDHPEPEDLYGLSKLQMEESLRIMAKVHNFEYNVARLHNVYGPRQSMRDPYRNVVMIWINKILNGEPYVIYGDGSMQRCYTYVGDVMDSMYRLGFGDIKNEIFNIGSSIPVSLKELSDAIQKVSGNAVPPKFLPSRAQEVKLAVLSHAKAIELLEYKANTPLLEGIEKSWEWAKQEGPQEPIYTTYEINSDKLPANWKK